VTDDAAGILPHERTLNGVLGIEIIDHGDDYVRGRMSVEDRVRQPYGIVHGGALMAIAETLASHGTALGVGSNGDIALGQEISGSYMRPFTKGNVNALARVRRKGRTAWNWEVELTDDDGRLCTLARLTIAVRPGDPRSGARTERT
jgi:1,4-dihydroxy-2-naphthoyl-CoA hydrolase